MLTENNQNIFNRNDVLTFEEIQASTDLSGKIASANALKNVNNMKLNYINYGANPLFVSFGNIGNSKQVTLQLTSIEQLVFIFGSGPSDTACMTMIGGTTIQDYSYGKNYLVSDSKDGLTVKITFPSWFRGVMFSYLQFTVSGL